MTGINTTHLHAMTWYNYWRDEHIRVREERARDRLMNVSLDAALAFNLVEKTEIKTVKAIFKGWCFVPDKKFASDVPKLPLWLCHKCATTLKALHVPPDSHREPEEKHCEVCGV